MLIAAIINLFSNYRGAVCQRQKSTHRLLQIGWETGERHRCNVSRVMTIGILNPYPIIPFGHIHTAFAHFEIERLKMLRMNPFDCHIPMSDCASQKITSCLNTVADQRIFAALQFANALNCNRIRSCSLDSCAHSIEEIG